MTALCITDGGVVDPVAAPVLAGVLDAALALYDAVADRGVPTPCAAGVLAGAAAAVDRGMDVADGCCGQLWVRLVNVYPTGAAFPAPDVAAHAGRDLSWAVVVEVGVVRPAPTVQETAEGLVLPTMAEEQDAAALAATDSALIRQALLTEYAQDGEVGIVLGAFVPFGPDGGVVGGATTATILVP